MSFVLTDVVLLTKTAEIDKAKIVGLVLLTVFYAIAYISMIIATIIVTKSDPTDPTVALEKAVKAQEKPDYRTIKAIESMAEYYCNICEVHVMEDSKHCQLCNRCSYEFDHHCRWVSNDIGRLNYILFLRMLICVAVTLIL